MKMDINIKKIKKIFGDEIIERLKKNLELKKEEETIFSVRNNINLKNYKSVKNIKVIKFKRSFSNKTVNRSNNSKKTLLIVSEKNQLKKKFKFSSFNQRY